MAYELDEPEAVGGVRLNPKMLLNHLCIVWSIDYIPHSPTKYSRPDVPSDVIVVDCVDLDSVDPDTGGSGLLARKSWWRQARLIQALKPRVGKRNPVLVRITQGTGPNAPYEMISMSSDPMCVARYNNWMNANPDFVPSEKPPPPPEREESGQPALEEMTLPPPRPLTQETILEQQARLAAGGGSDSATLASLARHHERMVAQGEAFAARVHERERERGQGPVPF